MFLLTLVSAIWALSFGLTKGKLAGLDSGFISVTRLGLAALVFLPLFRPRALGWSAGLRLAGIGAIEFGLMYLAYNESYRHLPAHLVALFTLTTPILVVLVDSVSNRRIRWHPWAAAVLALCAGLVITYRGTLGQEAWIGFGLVQAANFCFALGQVLYRRYAPTARGYDHFAALYLGAFALTLLYTWVSQGTTWPSVTRAQGLTLIYLGIFASGLCFFWWNRGAKQVGAGTLAVMNNAKVPLAVVASLWIFGESADLLRLLVALALLGTALLVLKLDREPS